MTLAWRWGGGSDVSLSGRGGEGGSDVSLRRGWGVRVTLSWRGGGGGGGDDSLAAARNPILSTD